jgi:hypothetical protein
VFPQEDVKAGAVEDHPKLTALLELIQQQRATNAAAQTSAQADAEEAKAARPVPMDFNQDLHDEDGEQGGLGRKHAGSGGSDSSERKRPAAPPEVEGKQAKESKAALPACVVVMVPLPTLVPIVHAGIAHRCKAAAITDKATDAELCVHVVASAGSHLTLLCCVLLQH